VQTPRRCGHASIAGTFVRATGRLRPCRISWLIVGITAPFFLDQYALYVQQASFA